MPPELIQINSRRPITRISLIILIVIAVLWCYFALRWYLGNTLADYFNAAENNVEMAQLATSLSPTDPLTHWRLGQVYQQKLTQDQAGLIVAQYEKAVSLSPNDYRYWMSLGIALEQVGDRARSEKALRQSVSLAPAYAYPRWYLGNLLLRNGSYAEAFRELRLAAAADGQLIPQLFRLAIGIYGEDLPELMSAIGDNPETRAHFATYLINLKRVDHGLMVWNSLSEADRKANQSTSTAILTSLVGLHRYHDAMKIWNVVAPSDQKTGLGVVVGGGFEQGVGENQVFGWQVYPVPQLQIGIDPQIAHSGTRSLRLVFQVRSKLDSIPTTALVPVEPATEYEFECYVKTAKLQGADTPFVVITNGVDGAGLASSTQAPQGDSDWTRISLSFKTGDKTEAVRVRLVRTACEAEKICPLFGAVWYDDFSIKRRQ